MVLIAGGTVTLAVTLMAGWLLIFDLATGRLAGSSPEEILDDHGIPSDARAGDCLKDGKPGSYEITACTDANAVWKITRSFDTMTRATFDAKMADGGDICAEGETTTSYSTSESDNAKVEAYCLARPDTAAAEKQAREEDRRLQSPRPDAFSKVAIGDCLMGDIGTDYEIVDCTDAAARWKVTGRVEGVTRERLESPGSSQGLCQAEETTAGHWDDDHPQARGVALCLASTG
ncbi:hypothetical protein Plo01_15820 [Planobispora longispora]|uniref:Uncharacterized protein n=1 Tax=Planobispora longispora TaxID=28887 RepID=A0A8J3W498_9ACTN|nr:hypothetical protein Plo01_15820 [Planobispora longispora]